MSNENPLINPNEINELKKVKKEINKPIVKEEIPITIEKTKYLNKGQTVKIELESSGRFGEPKTIWLKDYTTKHINDLVTVNEEDILETIVCILNECIVDPEGFNIEDCTNEDLFEILLGMKMSFDADVLKYRWYHSCQDDKPEDKKSISEYLVDLKNVTYKPIEMLDEELKEFYKDLLSNLSEEEYQNYIDSKYGLNKKLSIDEAIKDIKVQNPFFIPSFEDDIAVFEYIKIKHILEASKMASNEWNSKIRFANSKKHKSNVAENNSIKEEEIKKLKKQKARSIIGYVQALCLTGIKSKSTGEIKYLNSTSEKIEAYEKLPKNVMMGFVKALEKIKFGVNYEFEIQCDLCSNADKERRSLQRDVNFIELLPISDDNNASTSRKPSKSSKIGFYF